MSTRSQITRSAIGIHPSLIAMAFVVAMAGCSGRTGVQLVDLRANPTLEDAGPYVVYGAMLASAEYLDATFEDVAEQVGSTPKQVVISDSSRLDFPTGQIILRPDSSSNLRGFGPLRFRNTSSERLVLFIEPISPGGDTQGFTMARLEPGDVFEFKHNAPPFLVKVGAVAKKAAPLAKYTLIGTLVVVVGEEIVEGVNSLFPCNLSGKLLQPDTCVGSCARGLSCQPTGFRQYGPAFLGLAQPTGCACF